MLAGTLLGLGSMARRGIGLSLLQAIGVPASGLLCGLLLAACSTGGTPDVASASAPPGASEPALAKRNTVKVALLVPLSAQGHAGVIGKSLKQAAELALFERDNPSLQLIVKDDKGTPEGAKAAAEEAIKGGAKLILGPLFAKSATAIAPVARQAGVPVIAFSTDRQVAGNGVYLLSFQPAPEVARVVAFAARQGKRRFAALIPQDAFGKIVAADFTRGREPRRRQRRRPRDLRQPAIGHRPARADAQDQRGDPGREADGAPVDALFLPGGQESLEIIARLLPQAEIDTEKVKLIGTGGMDYPNVGRDAKLLGAWYPAPDPRGWDDFSAEVCQELRGCAAAHRQPRLRCREPGDRPVGRRRRPALRRGPADASERLQRRRWRLPPAV